MRVTLDNICLDVTQVDFASVVTLLAQTIDSVPTQDIVEGVLQREALGSTQLCPLVAVPHVRVSGVEEVQLAFARLDRPRPLSEGGDPLQFVMLIVSPINFPAKHLKALAAVARMVQDTNWKTVALQNNKEKLLGSLQHLLGL